jgi:hypothetical protein
MKTQRRSLGSSFCCTLLQYSKRVCRRRKLSVLTEGTGVIDLGEDEVAYGKTVVLRFVKWQSSQRQAEARWLAPTNSHIPVTKQDE